MKKHIYIIAAMAAILAACQLQSPEAPADEAPVGVVASNPAGGEKVFTASFGPDTKMTLEGHKNFMWEQGESIGVFDLTHYFEGQIPGVLIPRYEQVEFPMQSLSNNVATFKGTLSNLDVPSFYAVYPYNEDFWFMDGTIETGCDAEQNIDPQKGFDPSALIMLAKGTETFYFQSVYGYFRFKLDRDDIASLTFSFPGNNVFGTWVQINPDDLSVKTMLSDNPISDLEVRVQGMDVTGMPLNFEKGKEYVIIVPPGTYGPIKVTARALLPVAADPLPVGSMSSTNTVVLGRQQIIDLGTLTFTDEANRTYDVTQLKQNLLDAAQERVNQLRQRIDLISTQNLELKEAMLRQLVDAIRGSSSPTPGTEEYEAVEEAESHLGYSWPDFMSNLSSNRNDWDQQIQDAYSDLALAVNGATAPTPDSMNWEEITRLAGNWEQFDFRMKTVDGNVDSFIMYIFNREAADLDRLINNLQSLFPGIGSMADLIASFTEQIEQMNERIEQLCSEQAQSLDNGRADLERCGAILESDAANEYYADLKSRLLDQCMGLNLNIRDASVRIGVPVPTAQEIYHAWLADIPQFPQTGGEREAAQIQEAFEYYSARLDYVAVSAQENSYAITDVLERCSSLLDDCNRWAEGNGQIEPLSDLINSCTEQLEEKKNQILALGGSYRDDLATAVAVIPSGLALLSDTPKDDAQALSRDRIQTRAQNIMVKKDVISLDLTNCERQTAYDYDSWIAMVPSLPQTGTEDAAAIIREQFSLASRALDADAQSMRDIGGSKVYTFQSECSTFLESCQYWAEQNSQIYLARLLTIYDNQFQSQCNRFTGAETSTKGALSRMSPYLEQCGQILSAEARNKDLADRKSALLADVNSLKASATTASVDANPRLTMFADIQRAWNSIKSSYPSYGTQEQADEIDQSYATVSNQLETLILKANEAFDSVDLIYGAVLDLKDKCDEWALDNAE